MNNLRKGISKYTKGLICVITLLCFLSISSCSDSEKAPEKKELNVLILGNSVLAHQPAPDLGWYGDWGMAATAPENDFVHQYQKMMDESELYKSVTVTSQNIAWWENDFTYNLAGYNIPQKNYDLVIIRLGENVCNIPQYKDALTNMILGFRNQDTQVIITDVIWEDIQKAEIHSAVASENKYEYISFKEFRNSDLNYSRGLFENGAVAAHPSDLGMKNIAQLLFDATVKVIPE